MNSSVSTSSTDSRPARHLEIYLNDHRSVAVGGMELAKRCRKNNGDSDLGQFLDRFIVELLLPSPRLSRTCVR